MYLGEKKGMMDEPISSEKENGTPRPSRSPQGGTASKEGRGVKVKSSKVECIS